MSHHGPHPNSEILTLWALGDCDAFETESILEHIEACDRCRKDTAATQAAVDLVRRDADVEARPEQLRAARLAARSAMRQHTQRIRWPMWVSVAAAAGVLGLAVLGLTTYGDPAPDARTARGSVDVTTARVRVTPPKTARPTAPVSPVEVRTDDSPVAPANPTTADPVTPDGAGTPSTPTDSQRPKDDNPPELESPFDPPARSPETPGDATKGAAPEAPTPSKTSDPATPPQTPTTQPEEPGAGTVVEKPTQPSEPTGPGGRSKPVTRPTQPTAPPAMYLSSMVGVASAVVQWDDGRAEELAKGAAIPWNANVTFTPSGSKPVVLVLRDGGMVSIEGGSASIRLEPAKRRHKRHGPRRGRREDGGMRVVIEECRTESISLQPGTAHMIYVGVPNGYERPRRLRLGDIEIEMVSGTEMLATFVENRETKQRELAAIAELSGLRGLQILEGGHRRECPPDHVLLMQQPQAPARRGAAKAAGSRLKRVRRLHAAEALRVVLEAAKRGPARVAARLSDALSHLRPDSLRRNASSIARLLKVLAKKDSPPNDAFLIARYLKKADRAGLRVGFLIEKAIWAKGEGLTGEQLREHLEEIFEMLKRKGRRFGKGEGRSEKKQ